MIVPSPLGRLGLLSKRTLIFDAFKVTSTRSANSRILPRPHNLSQVEILVTNPCFSFVFISTASLCITHWYLFDGKSDKPEARDEGWSAKAKVLPPDHILSYNLDFLSTIFVFSDAIVIYSTFPNMKLGLWLKKSITSCAFYRPLQPQRLHLSAPQPSAKNPPFPNNPLPVDSPPTRPEAWRSLKTARVLSSP